MAFFQIFAILEIIDGAYFFFDVFSGDFFTVCIYIEGIIFLFLISLRNHCFISNQTFLEIVADNGLEQIVDFPTRKDNTLDLTLLSHPAYKLRCKPLPSIGNSASFKACQSDSLSLFPMFRNVFPNDSRSSFIL
jgi:hypothetical protein